MGLNKPLITRADYLVQNHQPLLQAQLLLIQYFIPFIVKDFKNTEIQNRLQLAQESMTSPKLLSNLNMYRHTQRLYDLESVVYFLKVKYCILRVTTMQTVLRFLFLTNKWDNLIISLRLEANRASTGHAPLPDGAVFPDSFLCS